MMTPLDASSIQHLLVERAKENGPWILRPKDAVRSADAEASTFRDVYRRAKDCAMRLSARGATGARIVIMFENGADFATAFFGALLANMIPVPFPPSSFPTGRSREHLNRLRLVIADCRPLLILAEEAWVKRRRADERLVVETLTLRELESGPRDPLRSYRVSEDDTAVIQYTSGSTGNPRGVELSHRNVLANLEASGLGSGASAKDVMVSWVPLFHDMGLIGSLLFTLAWGMRYVMLTPREFALRPASWLWAIHRFRGSLSPAPNFAFQLCATRLPDSALTGLDLGSWRIAFNGAETVQPETVQAFTARFGSMGLAPGTIWPVYGLAENALAVSFPRPEAPFSFDRVARSFLEREGLATPSDGATPYRKIVSVGRPLTGQRLRIMGPDGEVLADRRVGGVEVSGPSVMKGYYGNREATRLAITPDGWLRTGDRGYLAGGDLFLVGRDKDIVKRCGSVLDAVDVEQAVQQAMGLRDGRTVAFGTCDVASGTEALVIAVEANRRELRDCTAAKAAIAQALLKACGARPDDVVFLKPSSLPRTSSGKVRRDETRLRYLSGTLELIPSSEARVDLR